MTEELGDLVGAVRTFLQVHGRGRHFATGDWEELAPRSGGGSDAEAGGSDAETGGPDAEAGVPDAAAGVPDAAAGGPDAAAGVPDAAAGGPDAAPGGLDAVTDMDSLRALWGECARCPLAGGRRNLVFGEGAVPADLMFVGEGPGEQEDLQGRPFVGRAGELLTKMIEAMGLTRERVFIANVVKCRPPGNRDPEPGEVTACLPVLQAQIRLVRPRVLVSLGRISAQTLLQTATPISRLRGQWQRFGGVDLMPTFHPAYLLRSPEKKKEAWQDLQRVMERLREPHA